VAIPVREYLQLTIESAYGTKKTSPTRGTDVLPIRLAEGNSFTMEPTPVAVDVQYGGGLAVNAYTVSDKIECKGKLSLILCASQAAFFLKWAALRINTGQTSPWTTTEPPGDLASCSIYHAIVTADGTVKRRVYLGAKVDGWHLEVSEQQTYVRFTLDLTASTPQGNAFDSSTDPTSGTFPAPTDSQLPTDAYLFVHTAGNLSIASTRNQVSDIKVECKNAMQGRYFNNRFLQLYRFLGRETSLESKLYYAISPDDRASFEALTTLATSLELNNGSHTATLTLNAVNVLDSLDDDLPLNDLYFQTGKLMNYWDPNAGADLSWSFT
jgi:hypothetical protein